MCCRCAALLASQFPHAVAAAFCTMNIVQSVTQYMSWKVLCSTGWADSGANVKAMYLVLLLGLATVALPSALLSIKLHKQRSGVDLDVGTRPSRRVHHRHDSARWPTSSLSSRV